jgi:uncharacterized protein YprB with RNaseH-like and TPR domain
MRGIKMKHIQKKQLYIRQSPLMDLLFDTSSVFFDIETTGFSPAHSTVYLIGCARRDEETVTVDQFFAESPSDEKEVISSFLELLADCKTLISYNGIGFDIPFLKAKCDTYHLAEHFKDIQYLDIFKSVSSIKFLLKLSNYKQKTLEDFLGLSREDKYSGGDLINVYHEYCSSYSKEKEEVLLLHNYEDVVGMMDLLPVFSYIEIFQGQYSISETKIGSYKAIDGTTAKEMLITLHNDYPVPKRVSFQYKDFYFISNADISTLRIPVYSGELHFFYPNYKDYYYLPQEDMAVHKSVASFVDKGYRENARASNCYVRKAGEFLPQYDTIMSPVFKKEYKDKVTYFEITDDFCTSDVMLRRYVSHILQLMLTTSPGKNR